MKNTVFCLLFSLILNAYYLPKYKSIKPDIKTFKSGIVYLNATEFDFNKNIHIQITSYNSYIYRTIYYDFSDDENFPIPSKEIKPATDFISSGASMSEEDKSTTRRYYYEILKNSSKKYLFFKFFGYEKEKNDDYLEIESNRINWGNLWNILILLGILLIASIFSGCVIYHECIKKKSRKSEIIPLNQDQSENNNSNDNPDNKATDNPDFDNITNCNSNDYTNFNSNNEYNTPHPTISAIDNNYGCYSEKNIN